MCERPPTATWITAAGCCCGTCGRPYPSAAQAYAGSVLALLTPAELAALDQFSERALSDPDARPADEAEAAALRRVEALIGPANHAVPPVRRGRNRS